MSRRVPVRFAPREQPLAPRAVAAFGPVVARLVDRLLAAGDDELGRLEGVGSREVLILVGAEADLPWVDGVVYFGSSPEAPALLHPTRLGTDISLALLAKLLDPEGALLPALLVPTDETFEVYSLREARPLSRTKLEALRAEAS